MKYSQAELEPSILCWSSLPTENSELKEGPLQLETFVTPHGKLILFVGPEYMAKEKEERMDWRKKEHTTPSDGLSESSEKFPLTICVEKNLFTSPRHT